MNMICLCQLRLTRNLCFVVMGILCFSGIGMPQTAWCAQVTLAWDENTEPDIAGYRVFGRTAAQSYDYAHPFWTGSKPPCTLSGLADQQDYCFVVRAFNDAGLESGNSNEVGFRSDLGLPSNLPPIADAGSDQTRQEGVVVQLDGTGSFDPDDGIAAFLWRQTAGIPVVLSDPADECPFFQAPDVGIAVEQLTFTLAVEDAAGQCTTDSCTVSITWNNIPPNAHAGPDQTVFEGAVVTLDAAGSTDTDDGISVYRWIQTGGPAVDLADPGASRTTFTAPLVEGDAATLVFTLQVTDGGGSVDTDTVAITIAEKTGTPVALDQTVRVTADTEMNLIPGTNDPDGTHLTYEIVDWPRHGTLTENGSAWTYTPDADYAGPDWFTFIACDGTACSVPATVALQVTAADQPPVAAAGPDRSVAPGENVRLDGSNCVDPNADIEIYEWEQVQGPAVSLSDPFAVQPEFTAPTVGPEGAALVFRLTVTDASGLASSAACIVNVTRNNLAPTADAGLNQTVSAGDAVFLTGGGSFDLDDGIAAYHWCQLAGGPVELSDASAVQPFFTGPVPDDDGPALVFELTVTDWGGLMSRERVIVNVTRDDIPPVAAAGSDQTAAAGTTVLLDAAGSVDPDGDPDKSGVFWQQTAGIPVTLSDAAAWCPTFVAPVVAPHGESLAFRLQVADPDGLRDTAEIEVRIDDNGIAGFPDDAVTFFSAYGDGLGIAVSGGGHLTRLAAVDPLHFSLASSAPDDLLFGLLDLEIKVDYPGDTAVVTVYLPEPAPEDYAWYKYDDARGWIEYGDFNDRRDQVMMILTDGGSGDEDGLADGKITDPCGLAAVVPEERINAADGGGSGGGGGGCFFGTVTGYLKKRTGAAVSIAAFLGLMLLLSAAAAGIGWRPVSAGLRKQVGNPPCSNLHCTDGAPHLTFPNSH